MISARRARLDFSLFYSDTQSTNIYTLSLHDALPICPVRTLSFRESSVFKSQRNTANSDESASNLLSGENTNADRKSTRLNSSHTVISYAVFCLKKNNGRGDAAAVAVRPHPHLRPRAD